MLAPENTMPAFEFAEQHGAHSIELDVRLTSDGVLLVIHDETLERTTNGRGRVVDQSADSLQALDAAYHFDAAGGHPCRHRGIRLLSIVEVLDRFKHMGVNIDLKDNNTAAVDELARIVRDREAQSRVVVASFHRTILDYCRTTYPDLTTSACSADVKQFLWRCLTGKRHAPNLPVSLFQLPRRYFCFSFESYWFINAVHRAGGNVHFWTVNDAATMRRLIDRGADGIVTDRPDIAAAVIAERKLANAGV